MHRLPDQPSSWRKMRSATSSLWQPKSRKIKVDLGSISRASYLQTLHWTNSFDWSDPSNMFVFLSFLTTSASICIILFLFVCKTSKRAMWINMLQIWWCFKKKKIIILHCVQQVDNISVNIFRLVSDGGSATASAHQYTATNATTQSLKVRRRKSGNVFHITAGPRMGAVYLDQ